MPVRKYGGSVNDSLRTSRYEPARYRCGNECLNSDSLTQGLLFEQAVLDACGARYASAGNSGTSALHIACLDLGLGEGDWLWTTSNIFVALENCGL